MNAPTSTKTPNPGGGGTVERLAPGMHELSMSAALREALAQILRDCPDALLIGEDIGVYGGAFKITREFVHEFGDRRIIDTPISEAGIVSVAAGAALMGSRPIIEIMFMDFLTLGLDGLINIVVKWQEIYGDEFSIPLIIRCPAGAGRSYGPTHSQSFEGLLMNVPKLTICCPSNPADAAGLLLGAFESGQPTVFVEHKALYARSGQVQLPIQPQPIGVARILRPGDDVSILAYGRHVGSALLAAQQLEEQDGIQAEVIDLRTVKPLDLATITESLQRTGRGLSVEESPRVGGVGSEISALVMEHCFDYLEAPFARLGAEEQAIPCSPRLEAACFPTAEKIRARAKQLTEY